MFLHLFDHGKIYIMDEVFQNHRIQTRKNASNYNKIFDEKARIQHSINVVKAVENNLGNQHNLSRWIDSQIIRYFFECLKRNQMSNFYECYSLLPSRYRKNILLILIGEFPRLLLERVKLW